MVDFIGNDLGGLGSFAMARQCLSIECVTSVVGFQLLRPANVGLSLKSFDARSNRSGVV